MAFSKNIAVGTEFTSKVYNTQFFECLEAGYPFNMTGTIDTHSGRYQNSEHTQFRLARASGSKSLYDQQDLIMKTAGHDQVCLLSTFLFSLKIVNYLEIYNGVFPLILSLGFCFQK